MSKIVVCWFRRDLRLEDHTALNHALATGLPVLPLFIFDPQILNELPADDARVSFIYNQLKQLHRTLQQHKSGFHIALDNPIEAWQKIIAQFDVHAVYSNKDYEPYAIKRDREVAKLLSENNIAFHQYKDQVIFEENEVVKSDGSPYTVYTPYKNKWFERFQQINLSKSPNSGKNYYQHQFKLPSLEELGFKESSIKVKDFTFEHLEKYAKVRDFPFIDQTSYLSPHLRFGTVSIRKMVAHAKQLKDVTFLQELIWREVFMQILFHFPQVVTDNFKSKYDGIQWRNNKTEFEKWCKGETGYPLVDAGMRQLNETGYMHNRVRMVTAGFLCKHLLIDWRWGEAYFAEKLLDYDLSANNGNWQWAAGTGCDAVPYFRVFNPTEQIKKFDKDLKYIKKWVPEYADFSYPQPIVEHKMARERALKVYKEGLS